MNNVIITGGTGFIGSWLVEYLLSQDVSVCAIVRNSKRIQKHFLANSRFSYIEKDMAEVVPSDLKKTKWDCFYNLAWEGVSSERKNDLEIQLKNINNAVLMMELSYDVGCPKFISAGTVAEYAYGSGVMDFERKQSPNDYYGAAKVSTHFFLDVKSDKLNMPYIWSVLPSTFGERREDNNIITYTIKSLINGEVPQYGELNQMWDFLYVYEVARALYLLGLYGKLGKTYGIGSGDHRILKDYISVIRDMIDPSSPISVGTRNYNTKQLMSSCVDISELCNDTGFKPEISFEEGIRRTIEYMKKGM